MKKNNFVRFAAYVLCLCLLFSGAASFVSPVDAAGVKISQTVNLTRPGRNMRGHGYSWENPTKTLTLTDLYIDTKDDYGLCVADGATVVLEGDNYIKASKVALRLAGDVLFKGNGSLTLLSEDIGIHFYATDDTTTARFLSGTFDIDAGGYGIYSPATALSFVDGKWDITANDGKTEAIFGRAMKLYGGKLTAKGAIHATLSLDVQNIALSVTAETPALHSDKTFSITNVVLSVGDTADALQKAESYSGENCLATKPTGKNAGHSSLFGESVPAFVDTLLLILCFLLIAAGIVLPILRGKKKAKAARAALAALDEEAAAARRAEKAARKKR